MWGKGNILVWLHCATTVALYNQSLQCPFCTALDVHVRQCGFDIEGFYDSEGVRVCVYIFYH